MDALLTRLADSLSAADGLEALARPMLEMLEQVTGLESIYLTRIDEAAGRQSVLYARNARDLEIPEGLEVPWEDTLCRRALEEDRPYTDDVAGCWGDSSAARALGIRTYLSQPLRGADGSLYGTLCAASADRRAVPPEAVRILALFARMLAMQIDRERYIAMLRRTNAALAADALTDPLTGIPNRRALMEALDRALSRRDGESGHVAIAFIDLDGFKAINDRLGHDAGDRFLVAVARRLLEALAPGEFAARHGGDEFVVVAGGARPDLLRERLERAIAGRYDLAGAAIEYCGASIGITTAGAGEAADAVLSRADAAMYATKHARRRQRAAAGASRDCHFIVDGSTAASPGQALAHAGRD